jgi:hypothetical protein
MEVTFSVVVPLKKTVSPVFTCWSGPALKTACAFMIINGTTAATISKAIMKKAFLLIFSHHKNQKLIANKHY